MDEISKKAQTDDMILVVGAQIFNENKCKAEKLQEVENRVRQTMRLLSRMLIKFEESHGPASNLLVMFNCCL